MKQFDTATWARLTKIYPERAGVAYEIYLRDQKKTANPMTYFTWAGKRLYAREMRYQQGLQKYKARQKITME
jgi:hypothetical protein